MIGVAQLEFKKSNYTLTPNKFGFIILTPDFAKDLEPTNKVENFIATNLTKPQKTKQKKS